MKIAFLTKSLEAGRDGVGDYVRQLVGELGRQGHPALGIALADTADALDDGSPVVRLNRLRTWGQRIQQAQAALACFAPDWVSLQFVPYAWHRRGYAFGLAERLRPLVADRRRHLMYHELWVGLNRHDRPVNRLHGVLQRHAILRLHHAFAPRVVHTQAPAYLEVLARESIAARRLPLFGNLPVLPVNRGDARRAFLARHVPSVAAEHAFIAGWFGTIHPEWDGAEAVGRLVAACEHGARSPVLVSLGRIGHAGTALVARLRTALPPDTAIVELGETPPDEASRVLALLDLALTPNPLALAPKSGTVAACLDHGLPVLVTRNDWVPRGGGHQANTEPLLLESPAGTPIDLAAVFAARRPAAARLPAVVAQLLADLSA